MKKTLLLITILFINSFLFAQTGKKSVAIKPLGNIKKVSIINSGREMTYYALSSETSTKFNVKGPGVLKIITRARFTPSEKAVIKYDVIYNINGGKKKVESMTNVQRSKSAVYLNGLLGVPGQAKNIEIKLGDGTHNIELNLVSKNKHVDAKFLFIPTKSKKKEWINYSAKQSTDIVDVYSKEIIVSYYRFSADKPLQVDVTGPTELKLLTRAEYDINMKGTVHYRIQVKEKGNVINTYQLSSKPSETAVYKDDKSMIPGKACEFIINVPKGRHSYEIVPLDRDKKSILGRFLIPKKDVKL